MISTPLTSENSILDLSNVHFHRFTLQTFGIQPFKFLFLKSLVVSCQNITNLQHLEHWFFGVEKLHLIHLQSKDVLETLDKDALNVKQVTFSLLNDPHIHTL